ncbi:MAG: efflux RND transporter periplasmic adaptor subunit [Planctomycetaceae bacterium]
MRCSTPPLLLITAALLWTTQSGCRKAPPTPVPPKPLNVFYVLPEQREVIEEEEFTGRMEAVERIELRSRVSGYLQEISFDEGRPVQSGQTLFKIDARPFQAEEQRAAAAVRQFEARAKRLESQEQRARSLFDKRAMSEEEYEAIRFELTEAQASHAAALASHQTAQLNLQFTSVQAPLSGIIGMRQVDPGNLVVQDQTLLAVIVPVERLDVLFDLDERTVLRLRRLEQQGLLQSPLKSPVKVRIALADSTEFNIEGTVDFLDNQIDSATGTLRARATVSNDSGLLSPGLFVRLRYPIGQPAPALLIPEESLASDQGRPFVFLAVEKEGRTVAEARYLEPGPLQGALRVVRSGLEPQDRVIVTGLQRLRRNAEVDAKPKE